MKDTEIRGIVLNAYYERRKDESKWLQFSDFDLPIEKADFLRAAEQLGEHGLLEWMPLTGSQGQRMDGHGVITAEGVDAIESDGEDSPIRIEMPVTQNIHISDSHGIQIGDHNTQNLVSAFESLIQEIDQSDASDDEKADAKSKIKELLTHPLTAASFGAGLGRLLGLL